MLSTLTRGPTCARLARVGVPSVTAASARAFTSSSSSSNEQRPRRNFASSGRAAQGARRSGPVPREERVTGVSPAYIAGRKAETAPALLTLADLSVEEISSLVKDALTLKLAAKTFGPNVISQSLRNRSVAMIFSKRSTRTRVATETSVATLGGTPMFLGSQDIQLGVNESLYDSAKVIGSMVDGIMARVGAHDEVEQLAKHSGVPVINALSDLYHPTQILADLLTMVEMYAGPFEVPTDLPTPRGTTPAIAEWVDANVNLTNILQGKKIAWVGDTNNMTNEFLVSFPRFGMKLAVAAPDGYNTVDPRVMARLEENGTADKIQYTTKPAEAIKDADIIVTDTWISMGQEEETAARLKAFDGYQITNKMVESAGAQPTWTFMHCLPRHKDEVDDEVFYGDRSVVFPEAENRKWTIMACLNAMVGRWVSASINIPRASK